MRIGIDIGGTFTDFVVYDPAAQTLDTFKVLSTPDNPAKAMLAGLEKISSKQKRNIIHGSTVATNALLEGKGAPTALIATQGFRDVLQIGRQNRPSLYDLFADPPKPLVPRKWRLEVDERVNHKGEEQKTLDLKSLDEIISFLQEEGISSVAVSLLFSFLNPAHEQAISQILGENGFFVSASCAILPEFREYERTSTTVVNAYVSPIMDKYLAELDTQLGDDNLQIMQSNGGSISPAEARKNAVRCILSGPAGGAVGAQAVAAKAGFDKVIGFDMGGTSTDVTLIDNKIQVTTEAEIGGYPIRVPIIDIHTVGAGGGSIAQVDLGGALRVGPESAGADPGPACYGKGDLPTTTDANLVLGRLAPEFFLGGELHLDQARAEKALKDLGDKLALSPQEAALGVVKIANAHMERALRVISVERGHDPRDFTLVSFGGAGGLHAADLARSINIPQVLVPPQAATLSAYGMLMSDVVKDYSHTVMLPGDTSLKTLEGKLKPLLTRGEQEIIQEGVSPDDIHLEASLDLRYRGQSFELNVPFDENVISKFHEFHMQFYGYANPAVPVEVVNLRVKAIGSVEKPILSPIHETSADPSLARMESRPVLFDTGVLDTPFYDGEKLMPGMEISGPAIVIRPDTTILITAFDHASVDPYLNLVIKVGGDE